jgi:uncharacterized membrane protein
MTTNLQHTADRIEPLPQSRRNISEAERWGSMTAGVALALYGLTRPKTSAWILAGFGALLFRRGATGHCHTYDLLGFSTASSRDTTRVLGGSGGSHVDESITIARPVGDVYRFWRALENLPRFMNHLESVERVTDTLSRWRAKGPAATSVEWNAEIINEVPDKVIAWRSLEGSDLVNAGSVRFEEADQGRSTRLHVRMQYSPPGGKAGDTVARLIGHDPATGIREDLQRLRDILEDAADKRLLNPGL